MSTCNRCGVSAWHPEARTCTAADCELRQPTVDTISEPGSWSRAIGRGCLEGRIADYPANDVASDRQPEMLGRGAESAAVHLQGSAG